MGRAKERAGLRRTVIKGDTFDMNSPTQKKNRKAKGTSPEEFYNNFFGLVEES